MIGRALQRSIVVPCVAVGLLLASPARAHDRLDLLIARATREIAAHPRDATRYLARGEFYRADHRTRPALLDYAHALTLDPGLTIVHLARGQLLVEAGRPRAIDRLSPARQFTPRIAALRGRLQGSL